MATKTEAKKKEARQTQKEVAGKGKTTGVELVFLERMLLRNVYPVIKEYTAETLRKKVMDLLISKEEWEEHRVLPILECAECHKTVISNPPVNCPKCKSAMRPTNQLNWRMEDDDGKKLSDSRMVEFGEMSYRKIKNTLKELNEAEDLDPAYHGLYEKFVLNGKVSGKEEPEDA